MVDKSEYIGGIENSCTVINIMMRLPAAWTEEFGIIMMLSPS